jgi:tetratricopeptide (TPR) repeat protein
MMVAGSVHKTIVIITSTLAISGIRGKSAIKLISTGNEHYRQGELAEAIKCYNQAIQLEPENPIAWNNKGLILAIAGRFTEALDAHKRAVELDDDYVDAISNVGMAYAKMSKFDEALSYYDRALQKKPDHEIAWNNKGNLLAKMERHAEAMDCYDKALNINPNYLAAMNNKAVGLNHLKRYDEAIVVLDRVLRDRPAFAEGWYVKGKSFIGLGEFEKAIVCFERAYRLDKEFHQAKKALDVLKKRLVRSPGEKVKPKAKPEKPRLEMSRIQEKIEADIMEVGEELDVLDDEYRDGEHLTKEEAITLEQMEDEPISTTALKKKLGASLSKPAMERALEGLERKGLVTATKVGRGFTYQKTEALGAIDEEVIDQPIDAPKDSALGNFHELIAEGRKLTEQERHKEALSKFRRALIINPYDEMAICLKAQAHYELGERDKAINTMSQILNKHPDFLPAWFTLANVTLKHKEYTDAADCFRKVLEIQPDNTEAQKGLEKCEENL